jgi:hypothetical protein
MRVWYAAVSAAVLWARDGSGGGTAGWDEQNDKLIQLVACAERTNEQETSIRCDYDKGTTMLRIATYDVTVREASNAHKVGSVSITPAHPSCPSFVVVKANEQMSVYATPSWNDYHSALSRFVT